MDWLSILGDAFWILALAFIGATLRQLAAKLGPDIRVPMPWTPKGWRSLRPPRNVAFTILFGAPLILGLALSFGGRWMTEDPYMPMIFFGLKTATAGLATINHLSWLKSTLRTLLIEGQLKP
jgi:hypothetical protein